MYGIDVYQYFASTHNFDSGNSNPSNLCRCKKQEDEEPPKCLKDGAIDASKCQGETQMDFYYELVYLIS